MNTSAETMPSPLATFSTMLSQLEATSSKNDKIAILKHALNGDHGGTTLNLLTYALSPYITFGVKRLPEQPVAGTVGPVDPDKRYQLGCKLLDQLRTRTLTGHAAQETIGMYFAVMSPYPDELDAFKRVLLRDLRCDFSESSVNKAQKGAIPVFSCQLAASEMPDPASLTYPVAIEPKYDGVRCIAIKKDGVVTLFSRSGKVFTNFAEIDEWLTGYLPDNIVLDGEVMHAELVGDKGFQAVMKRARADRGKNLQGNAVVFQAFDMMPLGAWEQQNCRANYLSRRKVLESSLADLDLTPDLPLQVTPVTYANSADELLEQYRQWVDAGFEGLIVKSLDGGYTFKRNKTWMKLKPMATADLTVIDMDEGAGKAAGMLGALVLSGEHQGKPVRTKCGSGFTEQQRVDMWQNRTDILGRIAELSYQDMTQREDDSSAWSLRFPIFQRFRDVNGGKI